ncbi:ribonuclease P protein component [Geobacter sp.]|uniref:ribonuclease P protein component n=1 Tax=Geobacter sp. TaxID=46610 RepID=UPI0034569375
MFSFPKEYRLLRRADFLLLSAVAHKLHTPSFLILAAPSAHGKGRIGITVSRKVGTAVVRNRIKRLVREYYRHHKGCFVSLDVNVIARRGAEKLDFRLVCQELDRAAERLAGIRC